jgi:uncharacterized membrane protein
MRRLLVGAAALVGSWVFTAVMYGRLENRVAIHWNFRLQPDGYAPRVAVLVIGSALLLLPLLAIALSRIDPRRDAQNRDPQTYWMIWNVTLCLLAAIQLFIVANGAGWDISPSRVLPTLVGLFLIVFGNVEPRMRPNWFLGTRTPWTLSSDDVWRRTHRVGGRLSIGGGVLMIVGAWTSSEAFRLTMFVAGLVLAVVVPTAYSYVVWRRVGRPRGTATAA